MECKIINLKRKERKPDDIFDMAKGTYERALKVMWSKDGYIEF